MHYIVEGSRAGSMDTYFSSTVTHLVVAFSKDDSFKLEITNWPFGLIYNISTHAWIRLTGWGVMRIQGIDKLRYYTQNIQQEYADSFGTENASLVERLPVLQAYLFCETSRMYSASALVLLHFFRP